MKAIEQNSRKKYHVNVHIFRKNIIILYEK